MMKINKTPYEGKYSKCTRHLKEIAGLKRASIKADNESVRRCLKYENKIMEFRAEIKQLKTERSPRSQNNKKVLEEVGQPESNTTLLVPSSVNGEENEH